MIGLPPFPRLQWDFIVIDTPKGEDLILGFYFLNYFNPSICLRKLMITFDPDYDDYSDSLIALSNDFYTSTTCAALVGHSITPSFPSSFHITFLKSPQSLLLSRDEVFKEVKDVGEGNSISSIHLFHGNVDLPPYSYHDSLEEL
ncbi:hypothetical protein O181_000244 [Austropuccinia psidii MF-1]|uniref:Uncharacterized protein n=1 Tax=Austropuccinia psidii MF-1 TaxID=1389203 RepID=A0A9Q3B896_9BASI|nr:hypothetical protein [Austropuccinia psidii MF-1]